jgi:peroxiredoxin
MVLLVLLLGCGAPDRPGAAREVVWIDPPAAPGAMAPNLASAGAGGALMTWVEPAPGGAHRVRFSRFDGRGWSAAVTVAEGPGIVANWADVPAVAEADGLLIATWAEAATPGAHAYDVMLARSDDGGASWRRLGPAHSDGTATEHGFVSLLPEGARVRAFWLDGRATASGGAMTLRTALIGERVEDEKMIDERVCDCCSTTAVHTPDGPLIAYRDRTGEEIRDITIASGPSWQARDLHRDGWRIAGCPVNGPVATAAGRDVAIAWYTDPAGRASVRAAFSSDGGATFAPAVEVDGPTGGRAPLGRVGLVLDGSEALVGWMRARGREADILVRRVAPDGRLGPARPIARTTADRASGVPRMTRAGDRLIVAWTEPSKPSRLRAMVLAAAAIEPVGDAGGQALTEAPAPAGPVAGEPSPDYRVVSLAGRRTDLRALRGDVVLLNFWATWCGPCRKELTDLADLHRQRTGEGLRIVAVSIDDRADRDKAVADARELPFAVWLDPDNLAAERFGVRSLPTTIIVGRDGSIRWRRDGVIDPADPAFRAALDAALAAQRSGP